MAKHLSRRKALKAAAMAVSAPLLEKRILTGASLRELGANPHAVESTVSPAVRFSDIATAAGLKHKTIYGGEESNVYLLETTGCGVAFFDYDNDGWLDLFFVNGWRLQGFPKGQEPRNYLYHNNRDGTFTDVTERAGLRHLGWGQGVCIGDYDNDGYDDLFITYWGMNVLYHNNGDGTFSDVTDKAGLAGSHPRWGTGCAFVDYDRDGYLDLFVANYIDLDLKTAPLPKTGPCLYKGEFVACGPPGLPGGKNILYHNNGDGTFADVSEKAGILRTNGTYSLGVLTFDFDNDGWPDIYVANDSQPSALYRNNHNGTFTDIGIVAGCAYSQDGKPQAGMGVAAGDYDCDGWLDILKTNFSEDTTSLYRNTGDGFFDDMTFAAGLGLNTRRLNWGCGFVDLDNDGWLDIFIVGGHIYPEIEHLQIDIHYRQPKTVYLNLANGHYQNVSDQLGEAILAPVSGRGCAFGDFDNDGDIDVVVNPVNDRPQLLRCDGLRSVTNRNHWLKVRTVGTRSNRSGIGARIKCVTGQHAQIDEVRSGGSYASQSDLRVHFGLGRSTRADRIEVRWPSGRLDVFGNVPADRLIYVEEGRGIVKSVEFPLQPGTKVSGGGALSGA